MNKKLLSACVLFVFSGITANADFYSQELLLKRYLDLLYDYELVKREYREHPSSALEGRIIAFEKELVECEQELELLEHLVKSVQKADTVEQSHHDQVAGNLEHDTHLDMPNYFSESDHLLDESHLIPIEQTWFEKQSRLLLLHCAHAAIFIEDSYISFKKKVVIVFTAFKRRCEKLLGLHVAAQANNKA